MFLVSPTFDSWIDVLERLQKREGYDRLIVGHGGPTDASAIDGNVEFLETAREIYRDADDHEEYARRIKKCYPDRRPEAWVDLSAQFLYGVLQ